MRFAFIDSERTTYPITALCRVTQVARSGYHAWVTRKECDRRREDRILTAEVVAEFERSRRTYGSPRIQEALRARGIQIGRGRTARLMRERGLSARRKKAFRTVPKTCDGPRVAPNRLKRKFNPRKPGRAWVTDVKYVRTNAGWLYLAPVIDLFSRRVVATRCRPSMTRTSPSPRCRARPDRAACRRASCCTPTAAASTATRMTFGSSRTSGSGGA